MTQLFQPLVDGPIEIVGDIHGEIDALRDLLGHLGYADDGKHPEQRRLVLLGDLTDRGPDRPALPFWNVVNMTSAAGKSHLPIGFVGCAENGLIFDLRRAVDSGRCPSIMRVGVTFDGRISEI